MFPLIRQLADFWRKWRIRQPFRRFNETSLVISYNMPILHEHEPIQYERQEPQVHFCRELIAITLKRFESEYFDFLATEQIVFFQNLAAVTLIVSDYKSISPDPLSDKCE